MNAAALGGKVKLFGIVGPDPAAAGLGRILTEGGVAPDDLLTIESRPTTTKTRVVAGRQQIVRFDNEVSAPLSPEEGEALVADVLPALADASILILSDYLKGALSDGVIRALIDGARSRGVYVIVDPKRPTFEIYRGADLIKPNRSELAKATGIPADTPPDFNRALAKLAGSLAGALLVTNAEAGMSLVRPGHEVLHLPVATTHEVADVSGAGDTALAALAVALAEGKGLEEAANWANVAAGLAVAKPGTAIVDRVELEQALMAVDKTPIHAGAVVDRHIARHAARVWRGRGETVVFTNGCFDIIHPGHIHLLEGAAAQGKRLIVGLNTDRSVAALKGPTRPIQSETNRARVVGALRFVDLVVLFDEETPLELIAELQPDVIVKGSDYREDQVVGGELVKARGGRVVLVDLVNNQSSSRLIERARSAPAT
jgi:D-beta-D-heptose 7-phosphate kinase/D-beta-D-heptose 1-phosphate adenosyltransferase